MSIDSVSSLTNVGLGRMAPPPPPGAGQPLTDEQKSELEGIIARYDSETITTEGMKSMLDEIKGAGIGPGKALKTTLEEAGFELKAPQDGPPPGIAGATGDRPEPPQFVKEFMDKALSGEVTEDDITSFLEKIRSQNQESTGQLVDRQY